MPRKSSSVVYLGFASRRNPYSQSQVGWHWLEMTAVGPSQGQLRGQVTTEKTLPSVDSTPDLDANRPAAREIAVRMRDVLDSSVRQRR